MNFAPGWMFGVALIVGAASAGCAHRTAVVEMTDETLQTVRRELEARYAENEAGFMARDADRVMRLRHPAFHTITEDGNVSTREQMYERTRAFIARIERFDSLSETIVGLTVAGDTAHAIVLQPPRGSSGYRTACCMRYALGLFSASHGSERQRGGPFGALMRSSLA